MSMCKECVGYGFLYEDHHNENSYETCKVCGGTGEMNDVSSLPPLHYYRASVKRGTITIGTLLTSGNLTEARREAYKTLKRFVDDLNILEIEIEDNES